MLSKIGLEFRPFYWVQEGINLMEAPNVKGLNSEYRTEFLSEEDMQEIGKYARGYPEKLLISWLRNGRICIALKDKYGICTFLWIDLKECKYKPGDIHLKSDEAYISDMYTMESYRGRNLAPYLAYRSYDILNKMGRYKIYSISEFFNSSAIKYKQKLNVKNLELLLLVRLFGKWKWSFTIKAYS